MIVPTIELFAIVLVGFCCMVSIIGTFHTIDTYRPHAKRFRDYFTGECGFSMFLMLSLISGFGGAVLQYWGFAVSGGFML
jgi:hypothetical protein